ncbi:KinB-signaling pathway activation protein [Oceanobacillus zhaokaii]|uniref:KinB-signaling pathway activation protein n=1 Tax=Oceanobacillus zhaokaii TaxID=2052660 RepID=A0A345PCD1_9BACI|nr:KinB-signaling pathway activation protein [Oceanobacillus zhaokaii]AXI07661.1 KinB-signaling pathway activation protein [Oceanobacillus zhaokaii]
MNSRKLVNFLFKTLIIGGIAGLVISFFVQAEVYAANLSPFNIMEILGLIVFNIGLGFTFSALSMTGFFAYLFIHRFGLGFFRSFWPAVQVLLIAFILFDLVYFPYKAADGETSLIWFIFMAAALLVYGLIIAQIKAKGTNKHAFIPALFLMVVMTTIEWVPGLQTEGSNYAWLMIAPLLACNTYQLLALHRVTKVDEKKTTEHTKKKETPTSAKKVGTSKA